MTSLYHWKMFGLSFLIVIGILMIGVGVQEYLEYRKRK